MTADATDDKTEVDQTETLMTTTQVARYLGVNDSRIRQMHAEGKFTDTISTPLGRLYSRAEVVAMKLARKAKAAASCY
jgi:hypothetical protein